MLRVDGTRMRKAQGDAGADWPRMRRAEGGIRDGRDTYAKGVRC